jgi:hypothetical protein
MDGISITQNSIEDAYIAINVGANGTGKVSANILDNQLYNRDNPIVAGSMLILLNSTSYSCTVENNHLEGSGGSGLVGVTDLNTVYAANSIFSNTCLVVDTPYVTSSITMFWGGIGYYTYGQTASCKNGTAVAHNLLGTPTSITLTILGSNPYINSTAWYFVPTVLTVNATHFILSFCMNIGGTYTPVGTFDAKTLYWIVVYRP